MNEYKVARFLGWFSIGLGLTEVIAPKMIQRFLGTEEKETLIRAFGVREIASGVGILAQDDEPSPWVWSRVGGDALDLGTLGAAMTGDNPKRRNVGIAMAMVAGITALDVITGAKLRGTEGGFEESDFSNVRSESREVTRPFMAGIDGPGEASAGKHGDLL
jgi:hypothetical protein